MGLPLRASARVVGSTGGHTSRNSLFIAGNAVELVSPGRTEGARHTLTRVFDVHASDSDIFEAEVLPLAGGVAAGLNAAVIVVGHRCSGRSHLFEAIAPRAIDALFDALDQQHSAARGQDDAAGRYTVRMSYAAAVHGTDGLADLLSPGSAEVFVVRDAEAVGGTRLSGISTHAVARASSFADVFRRGRERLSQQGVLTSSVLAIEVDVAPGTAEHLVVSLLIADVEVRPASESACSIRPTTHSAGGVSSAALTPHVRGMPKTRALPQQHGALLL